MIGRPGLLMEALTITWFFCKLQEKLSEMYYLQAFMNLWPDPTNYWSLKIGSSIIALLKICFIILFSPNPTIHLHWIKSHSSIRCSFLFLSFPYSESQPLNVVHLCFAFVKKALDQLDQCGSNSPSSCVATAKFNGTKIPFWWYNKNMQTGFQACYLLWLSLAWCLCFRKPNLTPGWMQ